MSKTRTVAYAGSSRAQTARSHVAPVEGFQNVHRIEEEKRETPVRRGGRRSSVGNAGNVCKGDNVGGNRQGNLCKGDGTKDVASKNNTGRVNKISTDLPKQSKPLEVICLSDSEEADAILFPKKSSNVGKTSRNGSSKSFANSSVPSSPTSRNNLKTPPQKKDLEEYYRSKGLSLSHVRRMNKNYVRHDGLPNEARGVVFWDSFVPPPGFTLEDLPNTDTQASGRIEDPPSPKVSPVILFANKYKHNKNKFFHPKTTDADFEDIFQRLTKRKVHDNDGDVENPNPTKRSTPETIQVQQSDVPDSEARSKNQGESFNNSFPSFEDDLNDSALILCSQQVEKEYNQMQENKGQCPVAETENELSEIGNYEDFNPHSKNARGPVISSSTPVGNDFVIRKRSLLPESPFTHRNKDRSDNSSSLSLFENSANSVHPNSSSSKRQSSMFLRSAAKKDLFQVKSTEYTQAPAKEAKSTKQNLESAKPVESPKVTGDFMDDDDDELFSQVEMPVINEPVKNLSSTKNKNNKVQSDLSSMTTQIIGDGEKAILKNLQITNCSVCLAVTKEYSTDKVKVKKRPKRTSSPFQLSKKFQKELLILQAYDENVPTQGRRRRRSLRSTVNL